MDAFAADFESVGWGSPFGDDIRVPPDAQSDFDLSINIQIYCLKT
jgi:hypothetical protein